MKLITVTFFAVLFIGTTFGQTLKTYSGDYEGGYATYQYYEDADYKRVFNGKFSFTDQKDNLNLSRVHIPSSIEITGTFKENFKNGVWIAKEVLSSVVPQYGNTKVTMVYNGNFVSGKRNGQWLYKQSLTSKKGIENHSVSLNFSNNVLIGTVDFSGVKGKLDSEGNFVETWNVKDDYEGAEFIAEFKNNTFLKLIKRKISDGEILFRYENQNTVNLYFENQKDKQKVVETNDKRYVAVDCDKLDDFYNQDNQWDEQNKNFNDFYKIIFTKVKAFDRTIQQIKLGSLEYTITAPQIIFELKGKTNEERQQQFEKFQEDQQIKEKQEKENNDKQKILQAKKQQEQEEELAKQKKIREIETSDYGRLKQEIKNKFQTWLAKSDYETATDYETRIKTQADAKIKDITNEIVTSKNQSQQKFSLSNYGSYNVETQTFPMFYYGDTINVSVPVAFAKNFELAFRKTDQWRDTKTLGIIQPFEYGIVDNKWTLLKAAIFFNNHFNFGYYIADFKRFYKENDSYFFDFEYRPDVNDSKTSIKKGKAKDINTIYKLSDIPKEVYYYEWKSTQRNTQPLIFTLQDLNIILPTFNSQK